MILILSLVMLLILAYTIYSLTNHEQLYAEAKYLAINTPADQLKAEESSLGSVLWIFFAGGVLLTGVYAVQFFAGMDDFTKFQAPQWFYAFIGVVATLALTMGQRKLYSTIQTSKAGILVTFLILSFVIFSEIATSSERTDMLTKHRSENSDTYKIALQQAQIDTASTAAVAPPNINTKTLADAEAELADATYELGRCERHASTGAKRVEKCEVHEQKRMARAQGRINAVSTQNQNVIATAAATQERMAQQNNAFKERMLAKAEALKNDESQAPAIVRFLQALFGENVLYAMIFASLIFVIAFEVGFHFIGTRLAVVKHALLLKKRLVRVDSETAQQAADFDADIQTMTNHDEKKARAQQYANDVIQAKQTELKTATMQIKKTPIGFINPNAKASTPHPDAHPDVLPLPEVHPNNSFLGKSEEQLIVPGVSTYNAELAQHNIDSPADKALNKEADQASIQRIIDKGLKASSTHPQDALGMDSQNRPTPHPDAHPDGLAAHPQDAAQDAPTAQEIMADPGKLDVIKGYMEHDKFNEIFIAVCTGQTKPSQNGIKSHKVGGDMPKYVLVIMCYLELVSEPKTNKQRDLIATLTPEQAQQELTDAREIILGKE